MQGEGIEKKLQYFDASCRQAGLKLTHQRREIFRELAKAKDHPSAETLHKRLLAHLPTISIDTVYRTLTTLEKHDLITRVQTAESQARFEAEMHEHHHAICRRCGAITDFEWQTFAEMELPKEIGGWGRIDQKNVTLRGICGRCARKTDAS